MTFGPSNSLGPFLPINQTFSQDPEQFLIQITKLYADIARYLNLREIGSYPLMETTTGEQWFTAGNPQVNRQGYRAVFSIGAINAGATSTTAHGLVGVTSFTHIYGVATTSPTDQRPIPYASATAVNQQIEIKVDPSTGGNITIINGAAAPNITSAIVILEYLKN